MSPREPARLQADNYCWPFLVGSENMGLIFNLKTEVEANRDEGLFYNF